MRLKWMAVLMALMAASVSRADGFDGKEMPVGYSGEVAFEWVEDPFIPKMRLTGELLYRQSDGRIWVTPVGAEVDGRAFPGLFVSIFGQPLESVFRKTAITYDYAVKSQHHPWQAAQRMFYESAIGEGVSEVEAKVMYALLRAGGSRWAIHGPANCFSRCHGPDAHLEWRPRVNDDDVLALVDLIRAEAPVLDDIERRVGSILIEEGPHSSVPIR